MAGGTSTAIKSGEARVPRSASFDLAHNALRIEDRYARRLCRAGHYAEALEVIDRALALGAVKPAGEGEPGLHLPWFEEIPSLRVRLYL